MISGSYEHALDSNGRIIMPLEFRKGLGYDFVVTKGLGGCLTCLPKAYWEHGFVRKLEKAPMLDEDADLLFRFFCAEALIDVTPDSQGRIAISSSLREYADLKKDSPVMILGVFNKVEIWDKAAWVATRQKISAADISRAAKALGLGSATPLSDAPMSVEA